MDERQQDLLRDILTQCRVLSLAVTVDGAPYAGLLPFAVRPEFDGLLIHASGLARHTRGLGEGLAFGVVIHVPDSPEADPLQLPRVTLQGTVHPLERGTPAYDQGRAVYVAKFPASAPIFGLGDFTLFELRPEAGRLITGFGGAVNIGPRSLAKLGLDT